MFDTDQRICSLIEFANRGNMGGDALNFLGLPGNTWSFGEMFAMADRLADAFVRHGVGRGDVVLVATVNGPEEPLCLLALNRIGAVSKWVDVTMSCEELGRAIDEDGCRVAVVFPAVWPELSRCINGTGIELVVWASPDQFVRRGRVFRKSPSSLLRMARESRGALPRMPQDGRVVGFCDFMSEGREGHAAVAPYAPDTPAIIVQSSGTTGRPKSVVHTDRSVNEAILKFAYSDLPLQRNSVMLKVAPSWVAYGLVNTTAMALAFGMTVLMSPSILDKDFVMQLEGLYDVVFGVPVHYRYMLAHESELGDMSRPKALISGGDKVTESELLEFERAFAAHGCSAPVLNGAGCNEICGAGSVNHVGANKRGTIGVPFGNDLVSAFEPDTDRELPVGQVGEICYCAGSAFLGYAHDAKMTSEIRREHWDGRIWVHSRDLGYIDSDGFIHLQGRMSRTIVVNAFKISATHIEEVIAGDPSVMDCVVVGVPDRRDGELPMAFVMLDDGIGSLDEAMGRIFERCGRHLKMGAIPCCICLVSEIPYTNGNKQDFKRLESVGAKVKAELDDLAGAQGILDLPLSGATVAIRPEGPAGR